MQFFHLLHLKIWKCYLFYLVNRSANLKRSQDIFLYFAQFTSVTRWHLAIEHSFEDWFLLHCIMKYMGTRLYLQLLQSQITNLFNEIRLLPRLPQDYVMIWSVNACIGIFTLANKSGKINASICLPWRDISEEAAACCFVSLCCFSFNQFGFLFSHAAGYEGSISVVKMFLLIQNHKCVSSTMEIVRLHNTALFAVGRTIEDTTEGVSLLYYWTSTPESSL